MKHLLVLASLAFASTASADNKPLFEIRHKSEIAAPTSVTKVYANGTFTIQPIAADGTYGRMTRGALDHTAMHDVRDALHDAPWQITYSRIMCFAYAPSYTEYVVRGKVKWREQMCSGASADDATRAAIAEIEKLLPRS